MNGTLADRLREAMADAGMNQKDLADAVGIKPPSVHGWLSEKSKFLRGENLLKAATALNVSEQWLATGKGEKHPDSDRPSNSIHESRATYDVSQPVGLNQEKLSLSIQWLQDQFRHWRKDFNAADRSMLIALVYDELMRTPSPNWVDLSHRLADHVKGEDDERQRQTASAGNDDRAGNQARKTPATTPPGRK